MDEKKQENAEKTSPKEIKVIPAGVPFIAAGLLWFVLALILPIYKMLTVIIVTVISGAVAVLLQKKRKEQIALLPVVTPLKERAQELARNLDAGRDKLNSLREIVKNPEVSQTVESMALTLEKLADNVEANPKDRGKIRKVAVHYVPMIVDLVEKYINLENQGTSGSNISSSMAKIEEGLSKVDESLKQYLDDMFEDDKIDISTDIEVLKQLLNKDATSVNKLNFDDITENSNENGGIENEQ